MKKIPEKVKEFLTQHLVFVATADGSNQPHVVPKGDIEILDDEHFVFVDLYSHTTKKNLEKNPKVALCVVNPAAYEGYLIKGKAKIISQSKEFDSLKKALGSQSLMNHPQAKYAVTINVDKIIDIGYGPRAGKAI